MTIAVSVQSTDAANVTATKPIAPKRPTSAQSQATSTPPVIATPSPSTPSWHPAVTLALVTDTGTLPGTGPGLEAEGNLQHASLRLTLLAAWFTSREVVAPAGSGGTFQLAFGGALGCIAPSWGRWTPLVCGGVELGRLAGTGLVAHPETGAAFWRAVRADAGATAAFGGNYWRSSCEQDWWSP